MKTVLNSVRMPHSWSYEPGCETFTRVYDRITVKYVSVDFVGSSAIFLEQFSWLQCASKMSIAVYTQCFGQRFFDLSCLSFVDQMPINSVRPPGYDWRITNSHRQQVRTSWLCWVSRCIYFRCGLPHHERRQAVDRVDNLLYRWHSPLQPHTHTHTHTHTSYTYSNTPHCVSKFSDGAFSVNVIWNKITKLCVISSMLRLHSISYCALPSALASSCHFAGSPLLTLYDTIR